MIFRRHKKSSDFHSIQPMWIFVIGVIQVMILMVCSSLAIGQMIDGNKSGLAELDVLNRATDSNGEKVKDILKSGHIMKTDSDEEQGQFKIKKDNSGIFDMITSPLNPLGKTQESISSLREPILNLEEPLSGLHNPLTQLRDPIDHLSEPLTLMQKPLSDLYQSTSGLGEPLDSVSRGVSGLRQPITGLEDPIRNLEAPITELHQPISGLVRPISGLHEPLTGVSGSLSGVQNEISQLRIELTEIRKLVETVVWGTVAAAGLLFLSVLIVYLMSRRKSGGGKD